MSPGLDTTLTVIGFVVLTVGVIVVIGTAPMWFMTGDSIGPDSPRIHHYLVIAAVVLPPVVVIGLYITAVVLTCLATGSTFYYPLVALVVGAACWAGIVTGVGLWIKNLR